jgi:hypothetical protein
VWDMIPSLRCCVDALAPAFTQPSFATSCHLLLAWVMCLGKHSLLRVGENTRPQEPPDHSRRHGLDGCYNFFERSSWKPKDLACRIAVLVLTRLPFSGCITLLVDDTLAHKRGQCVWGLGWWRDAVASTKKRVATASGHSYQAVWPRVLGLVPIRVVVVRDPEGRMDDVYLFTTELGAGLVWVIEQFSWRWSIEVLFRASKQVMQIEAPQHYCQERVEKVAPWVWGMQSVIMVWYLTAGQELPQAQQMRQRMGPWDSEFSLRHMIRVLQRATLDATIQPNSASEPQLREFIQTLQNWALLAA